VQSAQVGAAALLAVESRVRGASDETELLHLIANELRKLVAARQVIVLRKARRDRWKVAGISSLVLTDNDTPFVRWIESMVRQLIDERGDGEALVFELPAFTDPNVAETRSYPFGHLLWQPMRLTSGDTFAGLLLAREKSWTDQDQKIVAREAGVFASAWQALYGAGALQPRRWIGWKARLAVAAGVIGLAALPVPMSTLASVEIVARAPQRVTAPLDGIIDEILVDPNRPVRAGQPILRFEQTTLRNRLEIAERELNVARARADQIQQSAFTDEKAGRELAQARAEHALKAAERDYARDLMARSELKAERDGILVYGGKDQWIGRPVRTGERIMQIVRPREIAARVEVPVADAIVLHPDARIRMFLDADPLSSIPARAVSIGYQAEPNTTQQLVYRVDAEIDGDHPSLRIGARGTAQLQGQMVPLAFYLLRRPISALRQYFGL
jgi:multidrug efflux pump subunit AcrA (membrane-fusion protein)